jgi:replicative superfamily II helicase
LGRRWYVAFHLFHHINVHGFIKVMLLQVEMTGDFTPDMVALLSADIIISTPEKWDGISRSWHSRSYVMKV